jgi:membrane protein
MPKWKHVWLGSIVTGILFTIETLLAFYFSIANPASVYELQAPSF